MHPMCGIMLSWRDGEILLALRQSVHVVSMGAGAKERGASSFTRAAS
jgi:hypothetical protein